MFTKNDFIIPALTTSELPATKCRAVICGVSVTPEVDDENLCFVKIQFLLISPELKKTSIREQTFSNWSIDCVESAIDSLKISDEAGFLIENSDVDGFGGLLGTVFDAEIHYRAYESKIIDELGLVRVVALPNYNFDENGD